MIISRNNNKAMQHNGNSQYSSATYQIGDAVRSGNFGKGVVRAFNPNGTLVVRFERSQKNQSVFPSFLDKQV